MAKRGSEPGERRGGRKKGTPNKSTVQVKGTLTELARQHTEMALRALTDVAARGTSEAARVSAASALLDRGYGKPAQFSTSNAEQFRKAIDMSDDELANVAAGGSGEGAAEASGDSAQLH